jgi:hypothetical protein
LKPFRLFKNSSTVLNGWKAVTMPPFGCSKNSQQTRCKINSKN